jgi:hypothetical protein
MYIVQYAERGKTETRKDRYKKKKNVYAISAKTPLGCPLAASSRVERIQVS